MEQLPDSYENWMQSFFLSQTARQCPKDFQALRSSSSAEFAWSCALNSLSTDMLSQLDTWAPICGRTCSRKMSR